MRKGWTIVIAVCLLLAVASVLSVTKLRTVSPDECSDVYRRYAGRDDVSAAYIANYRVSDSVTVAVTVLEAVTDSGWAAMCADFHIPVVPKEYEEFFYDDSSFSVGFLSDDMEKLGVDDSSNVEFVMAILFGLHKVSLFSVKNDEQAYAVLHEKLKENTL